jgi:multidrug efflux pump subunit AcrA (membrane-fusion protein)
VPAAAVRRDGESPFVWVLSPDGTLARRAIALEPGEVEEGGEVNVLTGLQAGERVVVAGPAELAPGQRVREVNE